MENTGSAGAGGGGGGADGACSGVKDTPLFVYGTLMNDKASNLLKLFHFSGPLCRMKHPRNRNGMPLPPPPISR